ncbi:MAG TPA: response regulator transcription factor [Blastocatellia bacterium]|jgi:CheY-like chemotaxis protein
MTLLIVEDNAAMRQMIRKLIGDLTDSITECSDGSEALAAYGACRPEWVLMDLRMKEMDGLAATRQIIADFPEARIVIVTDLDDNGLRTAARRAGACAYVVKENLLELRQLLAHEKPFTQETR